MRESSLMPLPPRPKLIALDGNGTLLRSNTSVSEYTKDVLGKVQDKGIPVVMVTGRSFEKAKSNVESAGIRHYVITENGARAVELESGKALYEVWIDGADAAVPINKIREFVPGKCFFVQLTKDGGLIEPGHCWLQDEALRDEALKMFEVTAGDLLEELQPGLQFAKCYVTFADDVVTDFGVLMEELQNVLGAARYQLREIKQLLPGGTSNTCEVQSSRVNKADALRGLCGALAIEMDDVWAFGDDHNDAAMLRDVGWGVRMANHTEALGVRVGKDVTKFTNDEDGVARYLEEQILT